MVFYTYSAKIANGYYNNSSIKQKILDDDRNPKQIFSEETSNTDWNQVRSHERYRSL
jgi:hypothetical protein